MSLHRRPWNIHNPRIRNAYTHRMRNDRRTRRIVLPLRVAITSTSTAGAVRIIGMGAVAVHGGGRIVD